MRLRDHPPRLLTHSDARRRHCFDDELLSGFELLTGSFGSLINCTFYLF